MTYDWRARGRTGDWRLDVARNYHCMAISPKALHHPNPWNLPAIASSGDIGAAGCDLTAEDLKEIDSALTEFKVHGGRMN